MQMKHKSVILPNSNFKYATEELRASCDEISNVDDKFLLKNCLDDVIRKALFIENDLYVIWRHWLVNYLFLVSPHANGQLESKPKELHLNSICLCLSDAA